MINKSDITDDELYFVVYCVTALSCNLNISASEVYELITKKTKILDEYIIKYYDILHTQSEDYIVQEIIKLLKDKGVAV